MEANLLDYISRAIEPSSIDAISKPTKMDQSNKLKEKYSTSECSMSSDSTILQTSQERYKEKHTILLLSINSWKSSLEEEIHKINAYFSPTTTAKNNGW